MLGRGNCVELWREGLEVGVFCEAIFGVSEESLGFGLEVHLGRAHGSSFGDEVVLVDCF